jgi:lysophospholipase L1-like esterase
VFLGDSICAGTTVEGEYYNYGWAGLIGEPNRMNWTNYGMNGGTVTSLSGVQNTRWLTTQADKALSEHPAADYVIFEGGCNDADQMKDALLGTISSDYANFDTTTFSGAFEALVLKLVTSFPTAKIGYIIPQKMYAQNDHTATGHIHRRYFDRAIEICEKWGIPYVDLWKGNPLNPKLSTASMFYTDGQHLTLAGYQRITPQIEAFMRSL